MLIKADQSCLMMIDVQERLVVIEDCGHLSPLERPRTVSAVMRYWLAR